MTDAEIIAVKKLIKEIKSKLYEIEKLMEKNSKDKFHFKTSKPLTASRKRNPFRESES